MKIRLNIQIPEYNLEFKSDEHDGNDTDLQMLEISIENLNEATYLSFFVKGNKKYIYPELIHKSIITIEKRD